MEFSKLGISIKQSATLKLNQTAAYLKSQGQPIIHLGGGEPKSKAPFDAIIKAASMINNAEVRYSPADGIPEAKAAAIKYMEQNYSISPSPKNVIISVGAKQALFFALQAILNPEDEIMFPSPYWVSYSEMAKMCYAVAKPIPTNENSFLPQLKDFEKNLTKKTKAVIINSPNNPTGVIYPEKFIKEIVEFTKANNLWLIMDDIYHKLYFDNTKPVNVFDFTEFNDSTNVIVIQGVSKLYAMTGFRIGWAVGPTKLIEIMTNIQAHTNSAPSPITQTAAAGALLGAQSTVEALRIQLENARNVMLQSLAEIPNVKVVKPNGTFYLFADFSYYEKDSIKLSQNILEKALVATMPGVEFGQEGHLRLSYNVPTNEIINGIERIKWLLNPNSPKETYIGGCKLTK